MGIVGPNSGAVPTKDGENGRDPRKELDAGALFVLKSRGSVELSLSLSFYLYIVCRCDEKDCNCIHKHENVVLYFRHIP